MHLKYFEWKQSKEPGKSQWDPTVNITRQQAVNWWMYQGSGTRPDSISPSRWAAVCRSSKLWWGKNN